MAPRVYLHIGAPKTGTTYLQDMLHAHRDQLREDGCLYPKARLRAHHDEARDLRGVREHGFLHPAIPGSWDRMVRQVLGSEGPAVAVVSSELLAFASAQEAERAIRALAPAEVHVVLTARDLVRQIPAVWQETVKNRNTMAYGEFLRLLEADDDGPGPRNIWAAQDPARVLDRWSRLLSPERVHLVTVPPRGAEPGLLWSRFAGVLGVDPANYPPVDAGANTSLGVAEIEVVRRLNGQVQEAPWPFYSVHIKHGIAQGVLAGDSQSARLVLPESALPSVERRTRRFLEALESRGYDVVGDLDDLLPPRDGAGIGEVAEPDPVSTAEASAAAADYLARRFVRAQRRWRAAKQHEHRVVHPVRRRLTVLSKRYRALNVLRRGYRAIRRRVRRVRRWR